MARKRMTRRDAQRIVNGRQAVDLRAAGMTWEQVAQAMGFASRSHARDLGLGYLASVPPEDVAAVRSIETQRLDASLLATSRLLDHYLPMALGQLVVLDDEGQPVAVPSSFAAAEIVLKIIDRRVKITDARWKVTGMDSAPAEKDPADLGSVQSVDQEIMQLLSAQVAANPIGPPVGHDG